MRIDQKLRARIIQLIQEGDTFVAGRPRYSDPGGARMLMESAGWISSAMNAITTVFPDPLCAYRSQAMQASIDAYSVGKITGILRAMLTDIDAGVVARVQDVARGEVFDEFLEHAEHYLRGSRVAQAGVIAGVVFEDTVRRVCDRHAIPEAGVRLDLLITELTKRDIVLDVTAKRARVGADVRTSATHAQWREFAAGDVQETIRIARELIEQHLAS